MIQVTVASGLECNGSNLFMQHSRHFLEAEPDGSCVTSQPMQHPESAPMIDGSVDATATAIASTLPQSAGAW